MADPDRAGGTAHPVGTVGPREAELDRDIATRGAAEHGEGQQRVHGAGAPLDVDMMLLFSQCDAAQGGAHLHRDTIRIQRGDVELRIVERHASGRDAELAEAVEPLGSPHLHVICRLEVVRFGRHMASEFGRVEARDRFHRRLSLEQSSP